MKKRGGTELPAILSVSSSVAAAHELKAPLALIRQLALQLDAQAENGQQRRIAQRMTLTAERALRLTTDMTKASRLEDALFAVEPVNPDQICREIVAELGPLFNAHGRTLAVKTRRHPLLLVANRDLLRRIVTNFSDNALHYTEPGTVVHMQVTALKKAGMVRIGVRDFGPAVSPDMWRQLQERLAVSPQSVAARPQSSGLGLYLAAQFAEAMQGTVGAVRHKDGATFYVDLHASTQTSLL